jgi:HAD superfamily hydrolase (TIGR01509 family)
MNRLIIFDLDGVLFESREMHFDTLNEALIQAGWPMITAEAHKMNFDGRPTRAKLALLGIEGDEADRIYYDKQARTLGWVYRNVKPNDEIVTLFTELHDAGWKIAVASNAITMTVMRALQLLGLWELCDFVTAADRGLRPKPAPDMYIRCMEVCDARAEDTWIVEDSAIGLRAIQAAVGAHAIIVQGPEQVVDAVHLVMTENS